MQDPGTRRLIDPEAEDKDEADPYVVGLALQIADDGQDVGVVTEERIDSPGRVSMNTVCGLRDLVCVPLRGLLHREDIWEMEKPTEITAEAWKRLGEPKKFL